MYKYKFSILIPTYKGAKLINETLASILTQSFDNFEVVIQEDFSGDDIENVISLFSDSRIKFFKNNRNLGYSLNLEEGRKNCKGDILFLMGQDDILADNALLEAYNVFAENEEIGALTRPYYWFDDDIKTPVRAKDQLNSDKNEKVSSSDSFEKVVSVIKTLDQLSGLAYRTKFMNTGFHKDCFTCHVHPFMAIFKEHPIMFVSNYTVAVRIGSSQTRFVSSIYEKSPMQSWAEMFHYIFFEPEFSEFTSRAIKDFVATNYVGLVQLRNYARFRVFLREIVYLIRYRWVNLFSPAFWFFSIGCIVTPPQILIPLVDWYKNKLNFIGLKHIKFSFTIKNS